MSVCIVSSELFPQWFGSRPGRFLTPSFLRIASWRARGRHNSSCLDHALAREFASLFAPSLCARACRDFPLVLVLSGLFAQLVLSFRILAASVLSLFLAAGVAPSSVVCCLSSPTCSHLTFTKREAAPLVLLWMLFSRIHSLGDRVTPATRTTASSAFLLFCFLLRFFFLYTKYGIILASSSFLFFFRFVFSSFTSFLLPGGPFFSSFILETNPTASDVFFVSFFFIPRSLLLCYFASLSLCLATSPIDLSQTRATYLAIPLFLARSTSILHSSPTVAIANCLFPASTRCCSSRRPSWLPSWLRPMPSSLRISQLTTLVSALYVRLNWAALPACLVSKLPIISKGVSVSPCFLHVTNTAEPQLRSWASQKPLPKAPCRTTMALHRYVIFQSTPST